MKTAIAIGLLGLALSGATANAQTAGEQARILRDFDRSVVEYSQHHKCLALFPEGVNAATPAPKIFTLPVAMLFRQKIAQAMADHRELHDALPPLPDGLEYRLIGDDLALRDLNAGVTIAVLRDALGNYTTVRR